VNEISNISGLIEENSSNIKRRNQRLFRLMKMTPAIPAKCLEAAKSLSILVLAICPVVEEMQMPTGIWLGNKALRLICRATI
jgi:hypothetical protein